MRRRSFCAAALLAVAGLAGCPSGGGTTGTTPGETPTEPPDTEEPTPTRTESPTVTIPSLVRELDGLRIQNDRDSPVAVEVTVRVQDSDESRTFAVELAAGDRRVYEDPAILERPVTVTARVGGETYEYTPTGEGKIVVTVTPDGVEIFELVT